METNSLVQNLETPIKATGSSSKGYVQRWGHFALRRSPLPYPGQLVLHSAPSLQNPTRTSVQCPLAAAKSHSTAASGLGGN